MLEFAEAWFYLLFQFHLKIRFSGKFSKFKIQTVVKKNYFKIKHILKTLWL